MRVIPSAVAALVLAGCAAGATIVTQHDRPGAADALQYALMGGPVPVVAVGNPFETPDDEIVRIVARESERSVAGMMARFAPASGDSSAAIRVVWHLSAPLAVSGSDLCAGRAVEPVPGGQRIVGAFCSGRELLAEAEIKLFAAPAGPSDADWRRVFGDALATMIVVPDPYEDLDT